jgi:sec-independent protein translocase protein TatA
MGSFSWIHWAIVVLVVVLIFGTKKLANLGGDLGKAVKGFKEGMKEATSDESADKPKIAQGQTIDGDVKKEQTKTEA